MLASRLFLTTVKITLSTVALSLTGWSWTLLNWNTWVLLFRLEMTCPLGPRGLITLFMFCLSVMFWFVLACSGMWWLAGINFFRLSRSWFRALMSFSSSCCSLYASANIRWSSARLGCCWAFARASSVCWIRSSSWAISVCRVMFGIWPGKSVSIVFRRAERGTRKRYEIQETSSAL